jgi:hypothetical protein
VLLLGASGPLVESYWWVSHGGVDSAVAYVRIRVKYIEAETDALTDDKVVTRIRIAPITLL